MVIALEAVEREATGQDAGERGQLVRDELVGQGVGLGRDAHGQVVALGEEDLGEQVRDRLAHAGTGFDGAVGRRGERVSHLGGHCHLFGSSLILPIHPRHGTAGEELLLDLRSRRHVKGRLSLGRVLSWRVVGLGEEVVPRRLEREVPRALGNGEVREHGPERPVHVLVHVGERAEKPFREVGEATEDDSPHATEGIDVVGRPVRHRVAAERLGHVGEPVGRETRKGDARERKRVNPGVGHLAPTSNRLDEGAVERGVVCEHGHAADELRESRYGVLWIRCICDVEVRDAGETRNGVGYRSPGVHEGLVARRHGPARESRRRYLDELAVLEGEARGLGVEDHDVVLEQTEVGRPRPLRKRQVFDPHALGRPWQQERLELGLVVAHLCGAAVGHGLPEVFRVLFERVLDEARAELGELDAAMAGGVGQEAGRRHAGNGVGLKRDGLALVRDDEISPRRTSASKRLVRTHGKRLRLGVDPRLETSRNHVVHRRRLVLHLEVVELGTRHDFDDGERVGVIVADDRHCDLRALDALLDEDSPALRARRRERIGELLPLVDLSHAEARAVARGLHEHGEAEIGNELVDLLVRERHSRRHVDASGTRHPCRTVDGLGDVLLGPKRGREHARERIGHMKNLEKALDAAVLSPTPVHGDKSHIITAGDKGADEAIGSDVEQFDGRKAGLKERVVTGVGRHHGDVALIRPTAPQHDHPELLNLISRHDYPPLARLPAVDSTCIFPNMRILHPGDSIRAGCLDATRQEQSTNELSLGPSY